MPPTSMPLHTNRRVHSAGLKSSYLGMQGHRIWCVVPYATHQVLRYYCKISFGPCRSREANFQCSLQMDGAMLTQSPQLQALLEQAGLSESSVDPECLHPLSLRLIARSFYENVYAMRHCHAIRQSSNTTSWTKCSSPLNFALLSWQGDPEGAERIWQRGGQGPSQQLVYRVHLLTIDINLVLHMAIVDECWCQQSIL